MEKSLKIRCNTKVFANILLTFSLVIFLSMMSSAEINDTLHINLQTTYANGTIQSGTFAFAFNITENSSSSCSGPVVYNHSVTETTDARGIVSIYLPKNGSGGGNLSELDFDKQYYLCYYRDGVLKDVSQLGRVPYSFRATQVNLSEITVDSNLNMTGFNITASWFKGIYDWIINASSQNYLNFNGTHLDFNESQLNTTIDSKMSSGSVNNSDLFDGYNSSFFMPLNTSVYGDFDFNGGWIGGGFSISGGDIFAQTVYVYNITSLTVSNLNINGSLFPQEGFDNTFDIGSPSLRWKDLHLSGEISSNGTGDNYFLGNLGIGIATPAKTLHLQGTGQTWLLINSSLDGDNPSALRLEGFYSDGERGMMDFIFRGNHSSSTYTDIVDFSLWNGTDWQYRMIQFERDGTVSFNAGNVGINITSPGELLEVAGNINSTGGDICITGGNCLSEVSSSSGSGKRIENSIFQTSHGFTVGNALYYDSSSYLNASSNNSDTLGMFIVSEVVDANNFKIVSSGFIDGLSGLAGGSYYFVSDSVPGSLTTSEAESYSNPILLAINSTAGYVLPWRASSNASDQDIWEQSGWDDAGTQVELVTSSDNVSAGTFFIDNSNSKIGIGTIYPQNKLNVVGDINATGLLYGNGSQLTGISANNIIDDGLYNSSELEEQADGKLGILDSFINLLTDNRVTLAFVKALGFYDNTEIYNKTEILNFGYYNSTDFDYNDYYLKSNPFGFYNSTTIPDYVDIAGDTMTGNLNLSSVNVSAIDCIIFDSGGKICSGS